MPSNRKSKIEELLQKRILGKKELVELLGLEKKSDLEKLFESAYRVKLRNVGNVVFFRGLIEFSNYCTKNCFYCGIRRDNQKIGRFQMSKEEIIAAARWAHDNHYGSVVLQSGERQDPDFIHFVADLVREIKTTSSNQLGITLALGEQSADTYKIWFKAGCHRYLLRIETSNPRLYQSLHPEDHDHSQRLRCLDSLRRIGYQVGTGVMIGLPGQSLEDLADDLLFFKRHDIDMIGMGPFIPHHDTPLGSCFGNFELRKGHQLQLGLKMIALARIYLKDVNIASTTALQALKSAGRELGLKAGANIIMPNITDPKYRGCYQLYNGKPGQNDNAIKTRDSLQSRIEALGETIGFNRWGDSPHFQKKKKTS